MSFVASSLVKSYLTAAKPNKIHKKFIRRKVRSSFKRIDFFIDEPNFSKNMRIFKENSVMDMDKSIFQNLMSSVLLRLHTTTDQVIRSRGPEDS